MSDRIPVEGITVDTEPHPLGQYALRWPNGEVFMWASVAELADFGIPVPPPPFKDPLGIGLTEGQCEQLVGYARRAAPDDRGFLAKIGRALLAAGYVPKDER